MEKLKTFGKKLIERAKKVGQFLLEHIRDVIKALAGLAITALVTGMYVTVGNKDKKITFLFEYLGALVLSGILCESVNDYFDKKFDDFDETLLELQNMVAEAQAAAAAGGDI